MVENNPHKISTMGTGSSLAAITDASDFPHTGLIKGLSQLARQNIVVRNNSNDFDITQASSGNVVQVSAGTYLRDGKLFTASAANFTIGTTSNDTSLLAHSQFDKGYHLLVVNSSNAIKIRQPTVANKVPDYTSGDTIIAVIEISSTTSDGSRNVQFLTTDKAANSLSIAYDNSNVYTETMSVIGDADRTTFKNKIANADIRFVLADNTADEKFEILTDDDSDGDEGDTSVFSVDGLGAIEVNADSVTTDNVLDVTADGLTTGAALNIISDSSSTATRNIVYIKNDHASAVNATVLKVESDADSESQAPVFHVKTAGAGAAVLVESTEDSVDEAPEIHIYRNAGAGTASDDLGTIRFYGQDDTDNKFEYAHIFADAHTVTNGAEKGRMLLRMKSASTYMNCLQLETGIVRVNGSNQDINFIHTADDGGINFFSDAGTNKIGIGTSTPKTKLTVEGAITLKEQATADTDTAAYGQIWTKTATPNELYFTNDAGNDIQLTNGATGPLLTGKHTIWIPSSAMTPTSTAGCSALTLVEISAGNPELQVLDFAADADDNAQFTVAFPKSWNEGQVNFQPFWTVTGTNTGDVEWNLTGTSIANNAAINTAYPTASVSAGVAHSGTSNDLNVGDVCGGLTIGNAAVDTVTYFKLSNDTGSSTQTGTARLIGIKLFYDIVAGNDE